MDSTEFCEYGGECEYVATCKVTRYNQMDPKGKKMRVCTEHRDALTQTEARYVGGWGTVVCETALLSDDPTPLDIIRDAAERLLHGQDYDNPQHQLTALAMALGVNPVEVEGILPDPARVSYSPSAFAFFREHAAWSYDPKTETAEAGRDRAAREAAHAEAYAKHVEWEVEWSEDNDADHFDQGTEWADWPKYLAVLKDAEGHVLGALGGVMFKDRGDETSDPYARVVAAELAREAMPS